MTQVSYRFRCLSCPYTREVRERIAMPAECPNCGARREARGTAAVIKKDRAQSEERRH